MMNTYNFFPGKSTKTIVINGKIGKPATTQSPLIISLISVTVFIEWINYRIFPTNNNKEIW